MVPDALIASAVLVGPPSVPRSTIVYVAVTGGVVGADGDVGDVGGVVVPAGAPPPPPPPQPVSAKPRAQSTSAPFILLRVENVFIYRDPSTISGCDVCRIHTGINIGKAPSKLEGYFAAAVATEVRRVPRFGIRAKSRRTPPLVS